jgi:hypothetical protein
MVEHSAAGALDRTTVQGGCCGITCAAILCIVGSHHVSRPSAGPRAIAIDLRELVCFVLSHIGLPIQATTTVQLCGAAYGVMPIRSGQIMAFRRGRVTPLLELEGSQSLEFPHSMHSVLSDNAHALAASCSSVVKSWSLPSVRARHRCRRLLNSSDARRYLSVLGSDRRPSGKTPGGVVLSAVKAVAYATCRSSFNWISDFWPDFSLSPTAGMPVPSSTGGPDV